MSSSRAKYEIIFASNRIKKDWDALERKFPERVEVCQSFLENNPEDRTKALGILKKLRPPYRGILQYDITKDEYRVWYRVDRANKSVIIKYAGSHPNWR
jgi:mRNA-degrading endonuclease RelE of RelBE toxin-antitoxin system